MKFTDLQIFLKFDSVVCNATDEQKMSSVFLLRPDQTPTCQTPICNIQTLTTDAGGPTIMCLLLSFRFLGFLGVWIRPGVQIVSAPGHLVPCYHDLFYHFYQ